MLCYVMLRYVRLCYVMLYYIILYLDIIYHIVLCVADFQRFWGTPSTWGRRAGSLHSRAQPGPDVPDVPDGMPCLALALALAVVPRSGWGRCGLWPVRSSGSKEVCETTGYIADTLGWYTANDKIGAIWCPFWKGCFFNSCERWSKYLQPRCSICFMELWPRSHWNICMHCQLHFEQPMYPLVI